MAAACLGHPRDAAKAAAAATSAMRRQSCALYACRAFWKLNRGFLDPGVSCASLDALQLMALASKHSRRYLAEDAVPF